MINKKMINLVLLLDFDTNGVSNSANLVSANF
jgi:hypothetical protein